MESESLYYCYVQSRSRPQAGHQFFCLSHRISNDPPGAARVRGGSFDIRLDKGAHLTHLNEEWVDVVLSFPPLIPSFLHLPHLLSTV